MDSYRFGEILQKWQKLKERIHTIKGDPTTKNGPIEIVHDFSPNSP
jgi:hypothetical protein